MLAIGFRFRRAGILLAAVIIFAFSTGILLLVLAIMRTTLSEAPEVSLFLKKLLPAGNCLCQSSTNFDCRLSIFAATQDVSMGEDLAGAKDANWKFDFTRDGENIGLGNDQCGSAFPGLFEDIYRAVEFRLESNKSISVQDLDAIRLSRGMVRAMVIEGKLLVIESRHMDEDHRKKGLAILHSIYRSISAGAGPIPNVEFVFSIEDMVQHPTQPLWSLARRPQDEDIWLMPDFGFWSWDIEDLGPFDSVVEQVVRNERERPKEDKIQKLIWRGALARAPKLRRALLDASKDKSWSDVEVLVESESDVSGNYMSAADQCNYMFVAHAEGRSYSGSLKYRQICDSVVIIHKMQWIQHSHYLFVASGPDQNYVEVERDFSDLDAVMEHFISHPEEAQRIADNSIRTFRERYLTMAAEACYWRSLLKAWSSVSFEPDKFDQESRGPARKSRGMRFENFLLLESSEQMDFEWNKRMKGA
ncbi:hypothetical protein BP6252_06697 [Coleophoma cylindrospora]|uniref:Glycosyl transferase CAP10 domain-containing protein n=1 Tax=Coleophoma cylindrospora TaxID=1849047 RepID=A0A3D8RFQ5_9HELO|nr:hypothetical protein BP6252_06697 [Coleophoma cylindrospora]